jgi:hypothetical protein
MSQLSSESIMIRTRVRKYRKQLARDKFSSNYDELKSEQVTNKS